MLINVKSLLFVSAKVVRFLWDISATSMTLFVVTRTLLGNFDIPFPSQYSQNHWLLPVLYQDVLTSKGGVARPKTALSSFKTDLIRLSYPPSNEVLRLVNKYFQQIVSVYPLPC